MKILFSKVNDQYVKRFQSKTVLVRDEAGQRYAVKYPLYPEGEEHISEMRQCWLNMKDLYPGLEMIPAEMVDGGVRFRYVEGRTACDVLVERLETAGKTAMMEELVRILDMLPLHKDNVCEFTMTDAFAQCFASAVELEGTPAARRCAFDFTPGNLIFPQNGRPCFIDYEWYITFPVPIDLLKLHFVRCLYSNVPDLAQKIPELELLEELQIDHTGILTSCYSGFLDHLFREKSGGLSLYQIKPSYLKERVWVFDTPALQVEDLKKQVDYLRAVAAENRNAHREKDNWMEEQARQIEYLKGALEEKKAGLMEKDAWMEEQARQIEYLKGALEEKDAGLTKKDAWIEEQAQQIGYLQKRTQDMNAAIGWHESQEAEKENSLQRLKAKAQQLERAALEAELQCNAQQEQIQALQARLESIEGSLAWRLTKPLHKGL